MIMMLYVIRYFSVILFLFTFFYYFAFSVVYVLPPYLHSDDEDYERYDEIPSTVVKTQMIGSREAMARDVVNVWFMLYFLTFS